MNYLNKYLFPVLLMLFPLFAGCAQQKADTPTAQEEASVVDQLDPDKKHVLAILGDGWHRVAPLDRLLVSPLRDEGWQAIVIMDYNVPWDDFDQFDLIIMSREGHEFVRYYRERDIKPQPDERAYWLTAEQEQKFVDYVNGGGRLFLYHDGFGNYKCGNGVSQVARSCFIRHPPITGITVSATGKMPEMLDGVDVPFEVEDEEYVVDMDESTTSVFLESHSPENGRAPQGWAHEFGEGRVGVLVPGHKYATITHPSIGQIVGNILDWLRE